MEAPAPYRLPRAWYAARFDTFLAHSEEEVIGHLTKPGCGDATDRRMDGHHPIA
jgi:hypothetical protein